MDKHLAMDAGNSTRDQIGAAFCRGTGVEIGAGSRPTATSPGSTVRYADIRSEEELRDYFASDDVVKVESLSSIAAEKFDFLIAHHVLEHSASTLETLVDWLSMLREGGILYLSLPNRGVTPDNLRLLTPPTHFVLDYLYGVDQFDYESREHIGSFLWSWIDVGGLHGKTKHEAANLVSSAIHSDANDLHWHTFNVDTMEFVVRLAAELAGLEAAPLLIQDGFPTGQEHRAVFRVTRASGPSSPKRDQLLALKGQLRAAVRDTALAGMEGKATHALSKGNKGKLFLVEEGKFRWIRSPDTLAERGLAGLDYTYFEINEKDADCFGEPIEPVVVDRAAAVSSRLLAMKSEPGIELSPGAGPILAKDAFNVTYLDKIDHGDHSTYIRGDVAPIDHVLGNKLIDEVLEHGAYSYLVSSHVIEHIPDFIQFFLSAEKVLRAGGKVVMWVPDKRYTFDVLRPVSTIDDIEKAHRERLRHPSKAMVQQAYEFSDFGAEATKIWNGVYKPTPSRSRTEALELTNTSDLSSTDVHCFTFTPSSMRVLLNHVTAHYAKDFEVVDVTQTRRGANEFLVEMVLNSK